MPKRALSTDRAPAPAGMYALAIAAGGFVFLAGQGPTALDSRDRSKSRRSSAR
jgi:enamine deaminase RidA (YjgF/YER057c/UK114 family)